MSQSRSLWPVKARRYVLKRTGEIRAILRLDEWIIDVSFSDDRKRDSGLDIAAEIDIQIPYLSAQITAYPPVLDHWRKKERDAIDHTICHELCHLFTEPLFEAANRLIAPAGEDLLNDLREAQTERVCRAMLGHLR